jgi:NADH pyrophosphatase NudC (nudix superfamily)
MYNELIRLMEWASADISGKTVDTDERIRKDIFCPKCGNEMRTYDGVRRCMDCFTRK